MTTTLPVHDDPGTELLLRQLVSIGLWTQLLHEDQQRPTPRSAPAVSTPCSSAAAQQPSTSKPPRCASTAPPVSTSRGLDVSS